MSEPSAGGAERRNGYDHSAGHDSAGHDSTGHNSSGHNNGGPGRAGSDNAWSAATAAEEPRSGETRAGGQPDPRRPLGTPGTGPEPAPETPVPSPDAPATHRTVQARPARTTPRATQRPGGASGRPDRSRRGDSPLFNDLQRWLIKSSAKNMRREIEGQVRRTIGAGRSQPEDIWGTATTETPPREGEAPECAWCPICRAARTMRDSGPGLGSQLSGASDVVASAVQEAMRAFDSVLSRTTPAPGRSSRSASRPDHDAADPAGQKAERAPDEPGDRG